jgi:hypothetical protein
LAKTLHVGKLLPVSESLSSMSLEMLSASYVTALAVASDQLIVGTSRGVLVIIDAKDLLPITSFRPYDGAIQTIKCLHFAGVSPILQREMSSSASLNSLSPISPTLKDIRRDSSDSHSDIYGAAVSMVKDRISTMIVHSPKAEQQRQPQDAYFITVGMGYRSVVGRFSSSPEVCADAASPSNQMTAIVWRADEWLTK